MSFSKSTAFCSDQRHKALCADLAGRLRVLQLNSAIIAGQNYDSIVLLVRRFGGQRDAPPQAAPVRHDDASLSVGTQSNIARCTGDVQWTPQDEMWVTRGEASRPTVSTAPFLTSHLAPDGSGGGSQEIPA